MSRTAGAGSGHPDVTRLALGIRQPWAELIVRGVKTIEVRSSATPRTGRFYVYAARTLAEGEAVAAAVERFDLDLDALPRGVLVGTIAITGARAAAPDDAQAACVPANMLQNRYAWLLDGPERLPEPLPIRFRPYGIWFYPFRRKPTSRRSR